MKVKCSRCSAFYDTENEQDMGLVCHSHKAVFQDFNVPFGTERYGKWPCCKQVFFSSQGCVASKHEEDKYTSHLLSTFETKNTAVTPGEPLYPISGEPLYPISGEPLYPISGEPLYPILGEPLYPTLGEYTKSEKSTPVKPAEKKVTSKSTEDYIVYEVQFGDTISGIAIRFHSNAGKIKQINKLVTNEEIHTRKTILIPKDPTKAPLPPKQSLAAPKNGPIQQVMAKTGVTKEEARFYLEDNDWVVGKAISEILQDEQWEREEEREKEEEKKREQYEMEMEGKPVGIFRWNKSEESVNLLVRG